MTHEILVRKLREYAENGKSMIDGYRLCRSAASAVEILDRLCDWYEAENKKLTEAPGDSFAIDLMNKLEKVEAERDAAVEQLHHCENCCDYCKSRSICDKNSCFGASPRTGEPTDYWQWDKNA